MIIITNNPFAVLSISFRLLNNIMSLDLTIGMADVVKQIERHTEYHNQFNHNSMGKLVEDFKTRGLGAGRVVII